MRRKDSTVTIHANTGAVGGRKTKIAGRVAALAAFSLAASLALQTPAAFGETESTAEESAAEAGETEYASGETAAATGETVYDTDETAAADAGKQEEAPAAKNGTENARNEKNETVYVISDVSGTPEKIIVSDWLVNGAGAGSLNDLSSLTEIENLKGDGAYTENPDGTITWDAQGQDLYYQGLMEGDEELPVAITVSYLLDGKEIPAAEAIGASGEITVRYSFENHAVRTLDVNGQTADFHIPFAAAVGFLVDEDMLKDVRITNGTIISDGSRSLAAGIAFPGMAEDLKDARFAAVEKLAGITVPDYVEITAQAENFRPFTAYALVTNEFLTGEGTGAAGTVSELFGLFNTLKSSIGSVTDGVGTLAGDAGSVSDEASALEKTVSGISESAAALQTDADAVFDALLAGELEILAEKDIETVSADEITAENYREVFDELARGLSEEEASAVAEAAGRLEKAADLCGKAQDLFENASGAHDEAKTLKSDASSLQGSAKFLSLEASVLKALIPDLSGTSEGVNALLGLAADYTNYSGIPEDMTGKVRFIWKISGESAAE